MSNSFPRSDSFPVVPGTTEIEWFPNLVGWELRNQSGTGNASSSAGTSHEPVSEPGSESGGAIVRPPETGHTSKPVTGRPRDPRFAAYYLAVRDVFPNVTTERGRFQKARALYAFDVLHRRAPELVKWFADGHKYKTKALAALARFDEPSIVKVAQQIIEDDMTVGHAVAFCDLVIAIELETP